jgi:hypothetical protein
MVVVATSPEAGGYCCMEDIAMLVFYLPIIIFEAMLEMHANHDSVRAKVRPQGPDEEHANALGRRK